MSLASYYQSQGVSQLNGALLGAAVTDFLSGRTPLLDNTISNTLLNTYMTRLQSEKSKQNKEAGEKFLAENKKRAGVITTESGLQYEVLTAGTGESLRLQILLPAIIEVRLLTEEVLTIPMIVVNPLLFHSME